MKLLLACGAGVCAVAAIAVWVFFGVGHAADSAGVGAPAASQVMAPDRLIVHEWGTFTSFSGSDGVPVGFQPNNTDLPDFVYQPADGGKGERLARYGTVSMETPVLYFYADKNLRVSARVDFPQGWITEWYPFAAVAPVVNAKKPQAPGQSIRWDVKLLAGEAPPLPLDDKQKHYYQARATEAVSLQAEVVVPVDPRDPVLRGGQVVQREKFLFYRGVGTFAPPVTVQALGGGKVRVKNAVKDRVAGLVLVTVHDGAVGFKALSALDAGAEETAILPPVARSQTAALPEVMLKELIAAGLYEKEARAMIKTWDSAWFGEDGTRLLYLVPRSRTDELLPLSVQPQPAEVVRVLVGRHDFLTPELEGRVEQQVQRLQAATAELQAAKDSLAKTGRFAEQARQMAEKRLETKSAKK